MPRRKNSIPRKISDPCLSPGSSASRAHAAGGPARPPGADQISRAATQPTVHESFQEPRPVAPGVRGLRRSTRGAAPQHADEMQCNRLFCVVILQFLQNGDMDTIIFPPNTKDSLINSKVQLTQHYRNPLATITI